MTFKEKFLIENPKYSEGDLLACPFAYNYEEYDPEQCRAMTCSECWNREVKEKGE